jgi:glycosyltransferase involved in cell wall biosynthesis
MPVISIIIPTFKEEQFLERTLENLKSLALPHEIIITDGGSTDRTLEIARRYTDKITVWDQPGRQTFGEAKNAGAKLAAGEFLVFIDADVIIPEPQAFFTKALAYFAAHPRTVAMTVPMLPFIENHSLADRIGSWPINAWYVLLNNVLHSGMASGEFQMMRADTFRQVGGYREDLAAVEDVDMFMRIAKVGRTYSYGALCVRHSYRRVHKAGWLKTYWLWIKNGTTFMLRDKAAAKEWEVVR